MYSDKHIHRAIYQYKHYVSQMAKICWAKLLCFSQFSGAPRKFFREYKHLSLIIIILNNEDLWPRQHENISVKTLMTLKP